MKSICFSILLILSIVILVSQEKSTKIEARILIKLVKDTATIEVVLKNNSEIDFETTPFGINHNSLVVITSSNQKIVLASWKDGLKKNVTCKKGELLTWNVNIEELRVLLLKANQGKEFKLFWSCESNVSNEIIITL